MEWNKQQRLRAIEIITFWHGRLNTGDLKDAFGISRNQASGDIKMYAKNFPDNFHYSLSDRAYLKSSSFKLNFTEGNLDEYIDYLSKMKVDNGNHVPIEQLNPRYKYLTPDALSPWLQSIREQKGLSVSYASLKNPEGTTRVIYPHALVDSGFRWHIRAYCVNNASFRDFNLGRVIGTPKTVGAAPDHAVAEHDQLWLKEINISFIANPSLNAVTKKIIENEFSFYNGVMTVPTRACLLH